MLLTLTLTGPGATELGFLLHKHPDRVQEFSLPFGRAHVFYPEASDARCTAALLIDVDPVGLTRRGRGGSGFALAEYVNDRPYVASSLLCTAMVTVFKTAMSGVCKGHEQLAASALSLEAWLPAVPAQGGTELVERLFAPLGYQVEATPLTLDSEHPEWGSGRHVSLRLGGQVRLADLLNHLYVLLPVLDGDKHYWVDAAEIEKLMRRGDGWLPAHAERELIVRRYLKRQVSLVNPALAQLEDLAADAGDDSVEAEQPPEREVSLREQRLAAVAAVLDASGAKRVLDLGCGAGALLPRLLAGNFTQVAGVDASARVLQQAARRLRLDELHDAQRARIALWQSPLTYRDKRLRGFDAAALVEVIEHLDESRLAALELNVFGSARPTTVVLTTPNAEYNAVWETLPAGELRHSDHRFEWTRAQFSEWAEGVASRNGYAVRFLPVGPEDPALGSPTQMAVFSRTAEAAAAGAGRELVKTGAGER